MFEDKGGFLIFGGGLVLLTIVATGLSLVMEKRGDSEKKGSEAEKVLAEERLALEIVRDEITKTEERLAAVSGNVATNEKYKAARAETGARAAKLEELRPRHAELKSEADRISGEFDAYRNSFVENARKSALGEQIDKLVLKSGREYTKVTIAGVTAEGLEIRHEFGSARVAATDLDSRWSERFQWTDSSSASVAQ